MRPDWTKIKNFYITNNISLEALAKKFKVSESSVFRHSTKEGWKEKKEDKKKEIDRKVEEKLTEKEIDRKIKANEQHIELYNKSLNVASKLLDMYMAELNSNKKKKKLASAYNLDFVTKAIANAQKGQRMALNIEKDKNITEIDTEPPMAIIEGLDIKRI